MKQLKDLLEQKDETIARIREKMLDDNDDEEKTTGYFQYPPLFCVYISYPIDYV
jgi:hypothetical protein